MWKRAQERFRTRSLVATIVLMAAIFIASIIYVFYVRDYTRQQSYIKLQQATEETVESIEGQFRADRNMLRLISRIISETDVSLRSLSISKYMNLYDVNAGVSDVGILMRDNMVVRINGADTDATGILDFNKVKEKGEHLSTLQKDLDTDEELDIRNFVPIRKEGKTIAFIYGTTTPESILSAWTPDIYDGHAIVSIIERDTGLFLADGLGRTNEILKDTDFKLAQITTNESIVDSVKNGRKGFAILEMADGQAYYVCFLPMNIANWELTVSIPEDDLYATVRPMYRSLYIFLVAMTLALVGYFLYVIHITTGSLIGIERRANMDALTGLQNRNRYEYFCQHLQQGTEGIACIYFDVNGLHEVNNTQGHLAGDNMLKTIASIICNEFGDSNTYRIGGDEFVAFRYERDEQAVRKDLDRVLKEVESNGYHVASGLAMATPDKKLLTVIKKAEEEMYENKAKYYESIGKEMRG